MRDDWGMRPWEDEEVSRSTFYRHRENPEKISARKFSEISGNDRGTIVKYLMTWNKAAIDGLVPHSSVLNPGQELKFTEEHTQELWEEYLSNFDKWYSEVFKSVILDERHTPDLWNYYYCGDDPCVYFIGSVGRPDLPVKIGKSKNVKNRLSTLQTSSSTELECLFTIPGYGTEEAKFHKLFDDKRTHGEWFNLTAEDIEYVRSEFESSK